MEFRQSCRSFYPPDHIAFEHLFSASDVRQERTEFHREESCKKEHMRTENAKEVKMG